MDRIDLGIFSRLVSDPFLSDERLAREVGLTGKAVRLRRQRLEGDGVLREYGVHPRPELLGRSSVVSGYVVEGGFVPPNPRVVEVDDLVYVMSFRPNFHRVVRFARPPYPPDDPRLARWLGRPLVGPLDEPSPPVTGPPEGLSRTDWAVLEAVVGMPRASLRDQAARARVSTRTMRRHRAGLDRALALDCAMILDVSREAGLATFGVWLKVDESFDARALGGLRLWDRPHWTRNPRGVYLLGSSASYFEARELELWLRSLPGVVGADPLIPAGGIFVRERLVRWIRAERERRFENSRRA
jgi:DNA-binding Lrp family transcriptional regulator